MKILDVNGVKTISKSQQKSISGGNYQNCLQKCFQDFPGLAIWFCDRRCSRNT